MTQEEKKMIIERDFKINVSRYGGRAFPTKIFKTGNSLAITIPAILCKNFYFDSDTVGQLVLQHEEGDATDVHFTLRLFPSKFEEISALNTEIDYLHDVIEKLQAEKKIKGDKQGGNKNEI